MSRANADALSTDHISRLHHLKRRHFMTARCEVDASWLTEQHRKPHNEASKTTTTTTTPHSVTKRARWAFYSATGAATVEALCVSVQGPGCWRVHLFSTMDRHCVSHSGRITVTETRGQTNEDLRDVGHYRLCHAADTSHINTGHISGTRRQHAFTNTPLEYSQVYIYKNITVVQAQVSLTSKSYFKCLGISAALSLAGILSLFAGVKTLMQILLRRRATVPGGPSNRRRASVRQRVKREIAGCGRETSTSRCHSGGSHGRELTLKQDPPEIWEDCKRVLSTLDDIRCQGGGSLSLRHVTLYVQRKTRSHPETELIKAADETTRGHDLVIFSRETQAAPAHFTL